MNTIQLERLKEPDLLKALRVWQYTALVCALACLGTVAMNIYIATKLVIFTDCP